MRPLSAADINGKNIGHIRSNAPRSGTLTRQVWDALQSGQSIPLPVNSMPDYLRDMYGLDLEVVRDGQWIKRADGKSVYMPKLWRLR